MYINGKKVKDLFFASEYGSVPWGQSGCDCCQGGFTHQFKVVLEDDDQEIVMLCLRCVLNDEWFDTEEDFFEELKANGGCERDY